jgi:hypothetical protein
MEKIFNDVKDKVDLGKTSLRCSNMFEEGISNARIFCSVSIGCLAAMTPAKMSRLLLH